MDTLMIWLFAICVSFCLPFVDLILFMSFGNYSRELRNKTCNSKRTAEQLSSFCFGRVSTSEGKGLYSVSAGPGSYTGPPEGLETFSVC